MIRGGGSSDYGRGDTGMKLSLSVKPREIILLISLADCGLEVYFN